MRVTYTGENVPLVATELLGYWNNYPNMDGYVLFRVSLNDDNIETADTDLDVQDYEVTRPYGDRWAGEQRSLVLRVPSVVMPFSTNYLINQRHPGFPGIRYEDLGEFRYSDRIAKLIDSARGNRKG